MISTKLVLTQRKFFVQTDLLSGITLVCHPIMDFVEQSRMWGMEQPVILFLFILLEKTLLMYLEFALLDWCCLVGSAAPLDGLPWG